MIEAYDPLLQEGLECLIENGDLWTARRIYAIETLIGLKDAYLENLREDAQCREIILKEGRNQIRVLNKQLKGLKKDYQGRI